MAKHRKTRKEKIRSELRTSHVHARPTEEVKNPQVIESVNHYSYSPREEQTKTFASTSTPTQKGEYSYLRRDLLKTSFVTGGIMVAQVALFLILNNA